LGNKKTPNFNSGVLVFYVKMNKAFKITYIQQYTSINSRCVIFLIFHCCMRNKCLVSSTIQTLLSVPELHRFNPAPDKYRDAEVANYHRRSGILASWLITLPRRN